MTVRWPLAFGAAMLAFAQNSDGVDPRPGAADYSAHAGNDAVSVGAIFLSPAEQRKSLGKDWSAGYVIVEVALYPEPGQRLTVAPRDFMLRAGTETSAPVDGEVLVPYPPGHNGPMTAPSKVHTQTVETVGVATGPYGRRTVYAGSETQVGVGNYPTDPLPTAPDSKFELRRALMEKELPDTKTSRAIAGYLYFPKLKNLPKDAVYELAYYGASNQLKLAMAPLHKH